MPSETRRGRTAWRYRARHLA